MAFLQVNLIIYSNQANITKPWEALFYVYILMLLTTVKIIRLGKKSCFKFQGSHRFYYGLK